MRNVDPNPLEVTSAEALIQAMPAKRSKSKGASWPPTDLHRKDESTSCVPCSILPSSSHPQSQPCDRIHVTGKKVSCTAC